MVDYEQNLAINTFLLKIRNNLTRSVQVLTQLDACEECSFMNQTTISGLGQNELYLNSNYKNKIRIQDEDEKIYCEFSYSSYDEQSIYKLLIKMKENIILCDLEQIKEGSSNILPLIIVLIIFISIFFFDYLRKLILRKKRKESNVINLDNINHLDLFLQLENESILKRERLNTIDVFRGIVILMMIFCNYGAGDYVYLQHSVWFGMTIADIIFPAFIFLMGCSLSLSLRKKMSSDDVELKPHIKNIIKRSLILFMLGLIINSINQSELTKIRIPGVLQRFSICYLIMATLHLNSLYTYNLNKGKRNKNYFYRHYFEDIYPFCLEWIFMVIIISIYSYFTLFFNYDENCPIGYQGPGGLHMNSKYFNCTGGAAGKIDRFFFGQNHIYNFTALNQIYKNNLNFDPEGILGTLPCIVLVFLGMQVIKTILCFNTTLEKIIRWLLYAALLALTSLILSNLQIFPISKNLWSLSFIFIAGSICYVIFTLLYIIIDLKYIWTGYPFICAGQNAIFLYLGHELCGNILPFYFNLNNNSHFFKLMRCTSATFIWLLISIYMKKKKIFIKI